MGDRAAARALRRRAVPGHRAPAARPRRSGHGDPRLGGSDQSRAPQGCAPGSARGDRRQAAPVQEIWRRQAFCALGDGDIDIERVLGALAEVGYAGWLVVEQDVLPDPDNPNEPAEDQRRNREYLRLAAVSLRDDPASAWIRARVGWSALAGWARAPASARRAHGVDVAGVVEPVAAIRAAWPAGLRDLRAVEELLADGGARRRADRGAVGSAPGCGAHAGGPGVPDPVREAGRGARGAGEAAAAAAARAPGSLLQVGYWRRFVPELAGAARANRRRRARRDPPAHPACNGTESPPASSGQQRGDRGRHGRARVRSDTMATGQEVDCLVAPGGRSVSARRSPIPTRPRSSPDVRRRRRSVSLGRQFPDRRQVLARGVGTAAMSGSRSCGASRADTGCSLDTMVRQARGVREQRCAERRLKAPAPRTRWPR